MFQLEVSTYFVIFSHLNYIKPIGGTMLHRVIRVLSARSPLHDSLFPLGVAVAQVIDQLIAFR